MNYEKIDLRYDSTHLDDFWDLWEEIIEEGEKGGHSEVSRVIGGPEAEDLEYADRMCVREAILCEKLRYK